MIPTMLWCDCPGLQEPPPADMHESVARQQQLLAEAAAVQLLERQQCEQVCAGRTDICA